MGEGRVADQEFTDRRRKEDLAFFVVRFLRVHDRFNDLWEDFQRIRHTGEGFRKSGLFVRVRDLEENLIFDIKEKAHFLFRNEVEEQEGRSPADAGYGSLTEAFHSEPDSRKKKQEAAEVFRVLRRSLIRKSIDSYVSTGFHMFMILRESVYQLEHYGPLFRQEHALIAEAEALARQAGYGPGDEEMAELSRIREIGTQTRLVVRENREMAERSFERCRELFRKTAEMVRLHIEESASNEILVLNLLRERPLVERTYGEGALEEILSRQLSGLDLPGDTAVEKARALVSRSCGNTAGIPRRP